MDISLTDTQRTIRHTIRRYLEREIEPLVPKMEAGELLPYEPLRKMTRELGLDPNGEIGEWIRMSPPEERLKRFVPRILAVEMARVCAGMAASHGASVALCASTILAKGTPEQRRRYAEPLLRMERIGSWALTEPGAGSAAFRDMKATATPVGDHLVLNGSKTFITNAPHADTFVFYARFRDEHGERIEPFILERTDPGLETGPPFRKLGARSSPTGELFLSECRIPRDRHLSSAARGRDTKDRLSKERIGLQAVSYGIMERAFEIALQYARHRWQGGRPIGEYQLVQRRLARMYMALANSSSYVFADLVAGPTPSVTPAVVSVGKLYVAEMATFVCSEAIHILGGYGYVEDSIVERLYRDAKLMELGGGTTEIQELSAGRWLVEHYKP